MSMAMEMGVVACILPTHIVLRKCTHISRFIVPYCTNPFKLHNFLLNHSCRFSFGFNNAKLRRSFIPCVVIDGTDKLNLTQQNFSFSLEEEDDDGDDFAAAEYDEVRYKYQSGDEEEEEEICEDRIDSVEDEVGISDIRKQKWERVEDFCAKVAETKTYNSITARGLAAIYEFPIDKFQRLAIESFLKGSSVVVCAPTSSGKTLIAEAAALATIAKGKRLLYTAPLKALSNQKFREFRETFGEMNVGLLTGDAAINREAPILIMTTEILRNMLYQSVSTVSEGDVLVQVDVIVLDEVHYLSDISRGTVWEETVIYCPKKVQLICLSATVSNPEELAGWIGQVHGPTDLVTSKRRPVPLTWHFSMKKTFLPLLNEKATTMNKKLSITRFLQRRALSSSKECETKRQKSRKDDKRRYHDENASDGNVSELSKEVIKNIRRSQVPQIRDTLIHLRTRDMLPAIWFIFSRKGCDEAVQYLDDCRLLDDHEEVKVESALKKFRAQHPEAVRETAVNCLRQGVAAHHAGCLPLWKSFIEELFQQGLVKVVFATETLAAGINMPARTTVISSVSKREGNEHSLLSSNALLQMAGRAGRRGIDKQGHVVIVQTPFEGAEECCKLLFAGPDPLVSQFSASYGMVLNLLVGIRLTPNDHDSNASDAIRVGRTLAEARALIEQSFGNYVSSEVMTAAKKQLEELEQEIEKLQLDTSEQTLFENLEAKLSKEESRNCIALLDQLKVMRQERRKLRQRMDHERVAALKPLLEKSSEGQIHFVCLRYNDGKAKEHFVPALYVCKVDSSSYIGLESKMEEQGPFDENIYLDNEALSDANNSSHDWNGSERPEVVPSYHVALGWDNSWYLFTEKWVEAIYESALPDAPPIPGDPPAREILKQRLEEVNTAWEVLAQSKFGDVWCAQGAIDTWSWSLNVPLLNSLSDEDEMPMPETFIESQRTYRECKKAVLTYEKRLRSTEWYKEFQRLSDVKRIQEEKIERLKAKSDRIKARLSQIEPTGWRDFLQIGEVLHEAKALDINTQLLHSLGETASRIRGTNELWLSMALRHESLIGLKPSQLAAVCGSLVSEGIRVRATKSGSDYIYEPSSIVSNLLQILEEKRTSLLQMQLKHNVHINCDLDAQFVGMVEAWASGLTWRELVMDCGMDDGDLARLLRRTIDILAQIPLLPGIDNTVQKNAKLAANIMDRPPISELVG